MIKTTAIDPGALDALVNYWLVRIALDRQSDCKLRAEANLTMSSTESAYDALIAIAGVDKDELLGNRAIGDEFFELGLRVAAAVLSDPFGDPRPAIVAALEALAEQMRSIAAANARDAMLAAKREPIGVN